MGVRAIVLLLLAACGGSDDAGKKVQYKIRTLGFCRWFPPHQIHHLTEANLFSCSGFSAKADRVR
jgi:hypothetical protein